MVCRMRPKWTYRSDHYSSYLNCRDEFKDRVNAGPRGEEDTMSAPMSPRRADRAMTGEHVLQVLGRAYVGRLATVSEDGQPYCIPLLYVWADNQVYLHGTSARGHLHSNVAREPRVCFAVDEQSGVFDYGRFECDSGLAYQSVILFGSIRIIEDPAAKQTFCERLMAKYGKPDSDRPKGFFPRLNLITVYALAAERMTGKEQALPALSEQWPAKDRTKTPGARP
jgi:uncharacterized protein